MNKSKTTIYKSGNSQSITLQKSILRDAKINPSFQKRWKSFIKEGGAYDEEEVDLGKLTGRELW